MHALLLAIVMGLTIHSPVVAERADLVELNHLYDEQGKLVFEQLIFWDWWGDESAYHVFAWRFVKHPSLVLRRDWQRGGYVTIWHDGDALRRVHSTSGRETWTQYDPEVNDRQFVRPTERRGLAGGCRSEARVRVPTERQR